ncbi:MAG: cytochrome c biogenesis protein CcsA [Phototrophicales bacterium]|nr:cytochrome c biogenesis protein CcsA [Phototrophicales bacterium]
MSAIQSMNMPITTEIPTAPNRLWILTIATVIFTALGFVFAMFVAKTDVNQGDIQRIFYFHMPSFFGALFGFVATVIGGINFLRTRQTRWDNLALAGVEVGLALALINLATGSIWARPIWNTWWTWDARLTSAAIMCLTYAAYLMLRGGIENPEKRRMFASVYGIVAITTAILTLVIIRIVPSSIHPAVIGPSPQNAEGAFEFSQNVAMALGPNFIIWGVLIPLTLIWWRIRLQNRVDVVNLRKAEALSE